MKSHIITAVLFSVLLIGTVTWMRVSGTQASQAQLIAIAESEQPTYQETILEDLIGTPKASPEASNTPLSPTETISRYLFSDYISLKSRGPVTKESLNSLAEGYASYILKNGESPRVSKSQITIIADSDTSLRAYNQKIIALSDKYEVLLNSLGNQEELGDVLDPDFKILMTSISRLYDDAAKELLALSVPVSLASNHLNLINNYFSSANATRIIADVGKNPVEAYAALNTQAGNTNKEAALLSNIRLTLLNKGLFLDQNKP